MQLEPFVYRWKRHPKRLLKSVVILTALCSFWLPAHSLDIYQWVDEFGKMHMADVVPEKYRAKAKLLNHRSDSVSDAERQNAEAKTTNSKPYVEPKPVDAPIQPTIANTPKPVESAQPLTCAQKWDEYHRSQDCFAPYFIRFSGGSRLNPEAYANCQEVKTPAMECEYDKRPSKN